MKFNSAKIDNQNMCTLDIYVPTKNFEKHINLGITIDHCDIFYKQLFNDLFETFIEHDTIGVSRYYEIKFETYDVLIDFGIKNGDLLLSEINMVAELLSPEKLVDLTEGIRYSPYEYGVDVVGFYGDYLGYDLEPEKSAKKL